MNSLSKLLSLIIVGSLLSVAVGIFGQVSVASAIVDCDPDFKGGHYGRRCPPQRDTPGYPGHTYHRINVEVILQDPDGSRNRSWSDTLYCDCNRARDKCRLTAEVPRLPSGRTGYWVVGPTASAGGVNGGESTERFIYRLNPLPTYEVRPTISVDKSTVFPGETITWRHGADRVGSNPPNDTLYAKSMTRRIGPMTANNAISDTKVRLYDSDKNVQNSGVSEQILKDGGIKEEVCVKGLFGRVTCSQKVKDPWSYRDIRLSMSSLDRARSWQGVSTLAVELDTAPGVQFCRQTKIQDAKYDSRERFSDAETGMACVTVVARAVAEYSLTPKIDLDSVRAHEIGSNFTVAPSVIKTGSSASRPAEWELTQIILSPGAGVANASGGFSDQSPCGAYYRPAVGAGSCSTLRSGSGVTFSTSPKALGDAMVTAGEVPVGTKYCFGLSVKPPTHARGDWRHSSIECVTIGKKPKLQVLGGDIFAGRRYVGNMLAPTANAKIVTSTSVIGMGATGRTFGSWGEYGIAAPGAVLGTASHAGLRGGNASSSQGDWSRLTFANAAPAGPGSFGNFYDSTTPASQGTIPDIKKALTDKYPTPTPLASAANVVADSLASGRHESTTDVSLSASTLQAGKSVVIYAPNRTVTVRGNLTNAPGPFTAVDKVPQLVIIAKSIHITDSVTQVDAWLLASDTVDTCSTAPADNRLTSSICSNPLSVTGPIAAEKLLLRRTAGSDSPTPEGRSAPAETLNLRADAYLWAYSLTAGNQRTTTTYTKELAPRF